MMTADPLLTAIGKTLPEKVRGIYLAYAADPNAQVEVTTECLACGRRITHAGRARLPMFCSVCSSAPRTIGDDSQRRARIWDQVGVPPEYRDARLDTFTPYGTVADQAALAAVLRAARAWLAAYPRVEGYLLFVGPPGSGKTRLAWAMLRELACARGVRVRLQAIADVVREIRGTWRRDSDDREQEVFERLQAVDVLVLDELSAHALPQDVSRDLYPILDKRLQQQRPTLLLTNESLESLEGVLNPALLDRVVGGGSVWTFPSSSYRIHRREQELGPDREPGED